MKDARSMKRTTALFGILFWLLSAACPPICVADSSERSADKTVEVRGTKFHIWGGMIAKRGDSKAPCMLIYGFPFQPSPIKTDGELPEKPVIYIESYDKEHKELQPTSDSGVPVIDPASNNNETTALAHAVNVSWQFTKPGITFESDGTTYKAEKVDATISFTKDGVRMDGIRKVK